MEEVTRVKMAKFRHNLHSQTDKIMSKKTVKTTTLTAQMTVCKMETGMDYVQVTPDNPCVGQVEAFRGLGYGQMLSTGSFEFTKHRIVRSQAVQELKLPHSSVSRCKDATHRFTFIVNEAELGNFNRWLLEEAAQAAAFIDSHYQQGKGGKR